MSALCPQTGADSAPRTAAAPPRKRPAAGSRAAPLGAGVDPVTRPVRWAKSGTSKEAQFIRHLRAELVRHAGGAPSVTERMLIERGVLLSLHLARMDAKALEAGGLSLHSSREYLAWTGALRRVLAQLGLKPADDPVHQVPFAGQHVGPAVAALTR